MRSKRQPRIDGIASTSHNIIHKKLASSPGIMDSSYLEVRRVDCTHPDSHSKQSTTRKRDRRKKEYWKHDFMSIIHICIFSSLFLLLGHSVSGFVIAPPWANPEVNKCSKKSWQLIYWPQDDKCYQIFEQGPCPRSQVNVCLKLDYGKVHLSCIIFSFCTSFNQKFVF